MTSTLHQNTISEKTWQIRMKHDELVGQPPTIPSITVIRPLKTYRKPQFTVVGFIWSIAFYVVSKPLINLQYTRSNRKKTEYKNKWINWYLSAYRFSSQSWKDSAWPSHRYPLLSPTIPCVYGEMNNAASESPPHPFSQNRKEHERLNRARHWNRTPRYIFISAMYQQWYRVYSL